MASVSSMVVSALVKIGEKPIGGTLTSAENTAYLDMMNAMLDSWALERLMCYTITEDTFSTGVSSRTYTIGNVSSAAVSTARPNKIVSGYTRDGSNYDHPLKVIGQGEYDAIGNKLTYSNWASHMYYDANFASGLGTISLWPIPSAVLTVHIQSWKQLQSFASITTVVSLPPGYQRAIEFNFAIEAAGGFRPVQPEVAKIARESKAAIKGVNVPDTVMRMDAGIRLRGQGNILDGP